MAINYKLVTATSDASSPDTVFTATAVATHVKSVRIANESGGALTYHLAVYDNSASIEVPITVPATSLPDDDVDTMVEPFNLQNGDYIKLYSSGAGVKVAITLAENTDTAGATTSDDLAEGTTNLYLTSAERTKLSGIATGAEVNQNAFSNVAVAGQTTVAADAKTDTLTLAAGTGITITTNDTTDTVTITNSVTAPNTFGTIEVSGQSSVVADSTTDTLTLAAANTNVVITTNATTDTITFGLGTDIVTGSVSVTGNLTAVGNLSCDDILAGGDVSVTGVISADSATLSTLNFTGGGTTTIGPNNALPTDPADLEIRTNGNCDVVLDYDNNESSQAFRVKDGAGNVMFSVDEDGISVANGTASTGAVLRLGEATANGTNYVGIQAPASLAANTTYTLPTADGSSGQVLSTDGTGTLSWATASGGSGNSFTTISVAGQSDVIADSSTDTLTLVAGTNVTITTNATTDTITIAASGGGTPAGSTGQIQYNNAGAFGAEAALYYDATNNRLSVGGNTSPTGTITSRGAGTTTGSTLLCEDSGGSARFTVYDRGTMFTNERSDIASSVHSFVFNATKNEYWRPTIAFKNTSFTSAIAAWLGDTNTLGYFGTLGGTAATGGLGLYGASSGASASNPTWQMQGFHGSTAPTEAIIRLVGTKYSGSGSGSAMLAALADSEIILKVITSGTATGALTRTTILGSGAMGLRNTAPTSSTSLTVRGHGTGTGISLLVENSGGTARFTVRDDGAYAFAGGTVGAAQTGYTTFTNLTTDRTCDANATTVEELADILGTLIEDLKTKGIIAA